MEVKLPVGHRSNARKTYTLLSDNVLANNREKISSYREPFICSPRPCTGSTRTPWVSECWMKDLIWSYAPSNRTICRIRKTKFLHFWIQQTNIWWSFCGCLNFWWIGEFDDLQPSIIDGVMKIYTWSLKVSKVLNTFSIVLENRFSHSDKFHIEKNNIILQALSLMWWHKQSIAQIKHNMIH